MGLLSPEKAVLDVLVSGENMILADLDTWLPKIFADRPQSEIDSLKQFLQRGVKHVETEDDARDVRDYRIKKFLGFPREVTELPAWAVILQSGNESRRAIGTLIEDETSMTDPTPPEGHLFRGSMFEGSVAVQCFSNNATLTVQMAALVRFILLYHRDYLEDQRNIFDQKIRVNDLAAPPDWIPEFTFLRVVNLDCAWFDGWYEPVEEITQLNLTGTWNTSDGIAIGVIDTTVTQE